MRFDEFQQTHRDWNDAHFLEAWPCHFLIVRHAAEGQDIGSGNAYTTMQHDSGHAPLSVLRAESTVFPLLKDGKPEFWMLTIGRASNTDIQLESPAVSKLHAYVRLGRDGKYTLTDAGSTNGTTVDGHPLTPNEPAALQNRSLVVLGRKFAAQFLSPQTLLQSLRGLSLFNR